MAFRMKTPTPPPKTSSPAPAFDSEALLRGSGLRVTRAAQTVLELLEHGSQPLTHEESPAPADAA